MTRATGRGSSSRPPTPRLPRPRGGLEAAVPSGPPRPQAPPTWREARGPRTHNRHTKEAQGGPPHAPATARPRRATRAPEGSRTSPPWWGRGRRKGTRTPEVVGSRRGTPTPLGNSTQLPLPPRETSAPQSGCPSRRQRDRDPTPLTRGRHFLSFLLVLSTSVSLSRSP